MDVMEALRTRRASRASTAPPVGDEVLEEPMAEAIPALPAINRQLGSVSVIRAADRLRTLGTQAKSYAAVHLPPIGHLHPHALGPIFEMFRDAPAPMGACAVNDEARSAETCWLAGETLMPAAHARGPGTCWIGLSRPWLNDAAVKAELGIAAGWHPVTSVVPGHRGTLPQLPCEKPKIHGCR